MRDFKTLPEALEWKARQRDREAWRSSDTQGEAFDLRYRRERAREEALQAEQGAK